METAIQLLNVFNAIAPGAAELILMIKRKDRTVSIVTLLDEADAQFQTNIERAQEWLKAHPAEQP